MDHVLPTTPLLAGASPPRVQPDGEPATAEGARQESPHAEAVERWSGDDPKRQLGLYDSIAMVLGTQIGSGIFISPALVVGNAGSEPAALATWSLAGLLAWACALCYVELGTRMPLNGGPQEYLAHTLGDTLGFLASWGLIFALKPCSAALLSLFISDYVCKALGFEEAPPEVYRRLGALSVIALFTAINCAGNTQSKIVTKVLLVCKIFGLALILALGLSVLMSPQDSPPVRREPSIPLHPSLSNYTDAILQALWAYSGWETVCSS